MDTKRYASFYRPGHAITGIRDKTAAEKRAGWGYEYAHSIVDDHSRVAYSELHPDQSATTVTGFVTRALAWFQRPRHPPAPDHDRQRLGVHEKPVTAPTCSPSSTSATS